MKLPVKSHQKIFLNCNARSLVLVGRTAVVVMLVLRFLSSFLLVLSKKQHVTTEGSSGTSDIDNSSSHDNLTRETSLPSSVYKADVRVQTNPKLNQSSPITVGSNNRVDFIIPKTRSKTLSGDRVRSVDGLKPNQRSKYHQAHSVDWHRTSFNSIQIAAAVA